MQTICSDLMYVLFAQLVPSEQTERVCTSCFQTPKQTNEQDVPYLMPTDLTPARIPRLHSNIATCYMLLCGLSSAMINALHNSVLPPKMEINPPRTTRGCPWGGETEKKRTKKQQHQQQKRPHLQPPQPVECICQCTITYTV